MVRRRAFLVPFLLLLTATVRGADVDSRLVSDFVRLLVRDDAAAVRGNAPESVDAAMAWMNLIDIIDRYECIEVQSAISEVVRADAGERLLRVTIHGRATTATLTSRQVDILPNVWYLKAVPAANGWQLAEVMTAERRLADAMIAAPTVDEARALIDNHRDLSRLANTLAWASAEPEIGERGFALIRLAGDIAASIADVRRIEYARQMESTLHTMLGQHDDAMRTANASLQSSLAGGNPDAIANAYFTLAVAHWAQNELQAAIDNFRRAVIGIDAMADPRHAIKGLINATHLESSRMHLSAALATADEVEQLSREYGWPQGELDALLLQGSIHDQTGNRVIGEEVTRKGYALAIQLQRRSQIVLALIGLGYSALDRGDPDEAIRIFSEVRDRSSYGPAGGIYLAMALEQKGRFAEAAEIYEVVQGQEADSGFATTAKVRLSHLALRASQPARALELARQASALVSKQGTSTTRSMVMPWDPKTAEGKALRALDRNADAAESFQDAIDAIEVARGSLAFAESTHVDFYGGREEPYRQLIELMVLEGRNADALRLSDRLKASLLDEVSDAQRINLASLLTDEERETQAQIEDDITRSNLALLHSKPDPQTARTLKAALVDARARWEQLQTTLYVRHGLRRVPRLADPLESPESLLPTPEDVILDFVVGERKTILFVLSRKRGEAATIETHTIARDAASLQRDVDRFLNRLGAASFDYEGDARALFRLLIAPAAKTLKGKKVVVVIGDGPLWRLPFQVLQTDRGEPLIRDFTLFTAPSLTSLQRAPRTQTGQRPGVLAIGNPRFAGTVAAAVQARTRATLGDLPDAAVEARAVAALYDRERSRLLIGHQATESAVKEAAARYDVLHVAAHAVTDDRQPLYSSIVLAREDSHAEDGLLEGREITRLGLNARLAVLSACSTAEGNVRPGEGLIGLSWAFLVAGCPTIVATQWRIPSESTSKLMIDFHRELARGDIPVAEALRQAQLRMMKDPRYRHPFYWSAFVVIGAGRS